MNYFIFETPRLFRSFVWTIIYATMCFSSEEIWAAPGNDDLVNGTVLSGSIATASGTTVDATRETGERIETGYFTVWYKWRAPENGRLSVSVTPRGSQGLESTNLTVWGSITLGNQQLLAWFESYQGETRMDDLPVVAGNWYSVGVGHRHDDDFNSQGPFDLACVLKTNSDINALSIQESNVTRLNQNNHTFANAITLAGTDVSIVGYGVEAPMREAGEPARNPNFSSWWKWVAPADGKLLVSTAGSELGADYDWWENRTNIVYEAESFQEMATTDYFVRRTSLSGVPEDLEIDVRSGRTYYVATGLGLWNSQFLRFEGGENPWDYPWRVITLRFSETPPPVRNPSIEIISPKTKVGRSFRLIALIQNPDTAEKVVWNVGGSLSQQDTNGEDVVSSRLYRAVRSGKSRRGSKVSVAGAVYKASSNIMSDIDTRKFGTIYRRYR